MYAFRLMTKADLPMVKLWLNEPHVRQWWGEPDEQFGLVSGDLSEPAMDQFIVAAGSKPFAYLQCYRLTDWNIGFGDQPAETRGIDVMLGDTAMMGHGHGVGFIREFADDLLATGTPRVVTDPDPKNEKAIHVYEKAGFKRDRLVDTPDGTALLMVRDT
jgi:aminoglycoside 6'-N-acetyltransferase